MSTVYTFEDNSVLPALRSLRRNGVEVQLQPKVFDLLLLFIRYRDQVLTKAELNAALWPGIRVSEAALTRLVKEVRRAIGDDGDKQELVRTVQRKGYRFMAKVQIEGGADADAREGAERGESGLREHVDLERAALRTIAALQDHRHDDAPRLCDALLTLAEEQRKQAHAALDPAILERLLRVSRAHGLWEHFARALLLDEPERGELEHRKQSLEEAVLHVVDPVLKTFLRARLAEALAHDPCRFDASLQRTQILSEMHALTAQQALALFATRNDWLWQGLSFEERLTLADRCITDARLRKSEEDEIRARLLRLTELFCRGEREAYESEKSIIMRLIEERPSPRAQLTLLRIETARATAAGDFALAETLLVRGSETRGVLPLDALWREHAVQHTSLLAAREMLDDVGPVSSTFDQVGPSLSARCVQLWLSACTAEHVQARLELRRLLPAGDLTRLHPADAAIVAASCALLQEPSPAPMLRTALLPHRGRHLLRGQLVCYGPCDYFLGVLSALEGDTSGARAWFQSAEELAQRSGLLLSLARVRLHAAELCESAERRRDKLRQALTCAAELGLTHMSAHLRAKLEDSTKSSAETAR